MLFWFNLTLQTLRPYPLKKCCERNTEILYFGQQPSSNPVILSSALDISHVQLNHTSVYRPFSLNNRHFDTILRNQSNQLSSKFIILWFSVTFLNQSSQATISLTSSLKECGRKKYMYG